MTIENNFCTQAQAIRLKELGISQKGKIFMHRDARPAIFFFSLHHHREPFVNMSTGMPCASTTMQRVLVRAFSAAELMAVVVEKLFARKSEQIKWPEWIYRKWDIDGMNWQQLYTPGPMADMIIHLLENKTIGPNWVNQRMGAII